MEFKFMPLELLPASCTHLITCSGWHVFRSREDDNELQRILRSLWPEAGLNSPTSRDETIKEKIKEFFQHLYSCTFPTRILIQFWAPVKIADKNYLTTADQPFAVPQPFNRLFFYRSLCLENIISIPVDVDEVGGEEHNLGPPGRVFRRGVPEYCSDISHYLRKEYLQRDCALELGLKGCAALPLFEAGSQDCVGVLEILWKGDAVDGFLQYSVTRALEKTNMRCGMVGGDIFTLEKNEVLIEASRLMEKISRPKDFFVQIWLAHSNSRRIDRIWEGLDSSSMHVLEGQGVVGKALSSRGACFCKDIKDLSISVCPYVLNARLFKVSSCVAICLKCTENQQFYILEFLFRCEGIDFGDLRTFITKLVVDLNEEIGESENSAFQKLKETLLVEVIRIPSDQDELDSFQICTTTSPHSVLEHPKGRKMMQHDSLLPQVDDTGNEKGSSSVEPNVRLGLTPRFELHQQQASTVQAHGEPSIELNAPFNENTLDVEYGITRDVLLQHSGKKLGDVANILGVSRSTLKRSCRKNGINRWHPNISRKTSIHQDAANPSNRNVDAQSTPNTLAMQDCSNITVKAEYGEDIWRFQLSHSAKKIDLEQQLVERLNSPIGSFKIKYLDEENERISISCDADLKLCIEECTSKGKTTIRMIVN